MKPKQKIQALRGIMKRRGVDAYLVPTSDPHQNEYVPECWKRRAWLSGFTGSAGELVVTAREACLWADGRYFIQAEEELAGSGIRLQKMGEKGTPKIDEYLAANMKKGSRVGFDPRVVSHDAAGRFEAALQKVGAALHPIEENLIDLLWKDRPSPSGEPIQILPRKLAGEPVASKLKRLRKAMKERKADAHLLTTLDAIAWLFNIRGRDVEYNPVAIAYAIVTDRKAELFIAPGKVKPAAAKALAPAVRVRPYDDFAVSARDLGAKKKRVWIDGATASRWAHDLLKGAEVVNERTPVAVMKSKKNATEIAGMRAAHVRDGVAMVRFLRWVEETVPTGKVTEISAAERLEAFRSEGEHYQGPSFNTISAYGAHGAIIHYAATPKSNAKLRPGGIYLIDAGGQYLDGTTDITRTILLSGRASSEIKDRFTRVLKGHIRLAMAAFPPGVDGLRLDVLARASLWEAGLDYKHGTGHGVGAYLNVHEGPQGISPYRSNGVPLEAGNILSNEPGYYKPGAYGIRTENLVLVVEEKSGPGAKNGFLGFETITYCPIDSRMVDVALLSREERAWLNDYHARVHRALGRHLRGRDRAWLKKACAAV